MRGKLTQRTVEQARQQARKAAKAIYFWDTDLKGFGCYVSAKGDVSWIVQRWIGGRGGKSIRYTIERASVMPLDAARNQAAIELGEVRKGVDIAQRKRDELQALNEQINGATLSETFDRYFKRKAKPGFYWLTVEQTFKGQLIPELGAEKLVSEITKRDVRKLIEAKEDIGQQAAAQRRFAIASGSSACMAIGSSISQRLALGWFGTGPDGSPTMQRSMSAPLEPLRASMTKLGTARTLKVGRNCLSGQ